MTHDESEHRDRTEQPSGTDTPYRLDDGDVSELQSKLTRRNEPFAHATVVRREQPASANVGDQAIVTADGEIHGWVGGVSCAQSVVSQAGVDAIESGEPTLVGIAPDPETVARPGLDAHPMGCHSDGVLEVFIEPVIPAAKLVVVGDSPIAETLGRLTAELAFDITLVVDDDVALDVPDSVDVVSAVDPETIAETAGPNPIVVVASMGKYDARGIAAGVLADATYIGLIASDDRAETEIERAAGSIDRDFSEVAAAVTNPAGVNIDAYAPAEIAVSLLAEVVDVRSHRTATTPDSAVDPADAAESTAVDEEAIDPVCGMTVVPQEAATTVSHNGETYYFCCHGCADSFENDPESYLKSTPGSKGHT